nr:nucleoprotein [Rice thrips mononega-like virus 1]
MSRLTLAQRLGACRARQGIPLVAGLSTMTMQRMAVAKPLCPQAFGDISQEVPDVRYTWYSRIACTGLYVRHMGQINDWNDEQLTSNLIAELGVTWVYDAPDTTAPAINEARQKLIRVIRQSITQEDIDTVLHYYVENLYKPEYLGLTEPITVGTMTQQASLQFTAFHKHMLNAVPIHLFQNPAHHVFRDAILLSGGVEDVALDDPGMGAAAGAGNANAVNQNPLANDTTVADDWANQVQDWDFQTILNFCHILGIADLNQTMSTAFGAAATLIAVLCKGESVTQNWVVRRAAAVGVIHGAMDLNDKFNEAVVVSIAKAYKRDNIPLDDLLKYLITTYFSTTGLDTRPYAWMVEQAALSHITPAIAFAHSIQSMHWANLSYLHTLIPRTQFVNFIHLTLLMYCNPYGGILNPPIPSAHYADVAYIGLALEKKLDARTTYNQYRGQPRDTIKTRRELDAIVQTMVDQSQSIMDDERTLAKIFTQLLNVRGTEDGDYCYIPVDNNAALQNVAYEGYVGPVPQLGDQDGNQAAMVAGAIIDNEREEEIRMATRADWPAKKRLLPRNFARLNRSGMAQAILNNEPQLMKDVRTCCEVLYSISKQTSVFNEYTMNAANTQLRVTVTKQLNQELIDIQRRNEIPNAGLCLAPAEHKIITVNIAPANDDITADSIFNHGDILVTYAIWNNQDVAVHPGYQASVNLPYGFRPAHHQPQQAPPAGVPPNNAANAANAALNAAVGGGAGQQLQAAGQVGGNNNGPQNNEGIILEQMDGLGEDLFPVNPQNAAGGGGEEEQQEEEQPENEQDDGQQ